MLDVATKYVITDKNTNDSFLPRTIHTMKSIAYDAYWAVRETVTIRKEPSHDRSCRLDDEMLCYDAIYRICYQSTQQQLPLDSFSLQTSWSGLLPEFTKRRQRSFLSPLRIRSPIHCGMKLCKWPLDARLGRQEYHSLPRMQGDVLPILPQLFL